MSDSATFRGTLEEYRKVSDNIENVCSQFRNLGKCEHCTAHRRAHALSCPLHVFAMGDIQC